MPLIERIDKQRPVLSWQVDELAGASAWVSRVYYEQTNVFCTWVTASTVPRPRICMFSYRQRPPVIAGKISRIYKSGGVLYSTAQNMFKLPLVTRGLWKSITFLIWSLGAMYMLWSHYDVIPMLYALFLSWYCIRWYISVRTGKNEDTPDELLQKMVYGQGAGPFPADLVWYVYCFFPLPFLAYALDWKLLILYIIMVSGWHWCFLKIRR